MPTTPTCDPDDRHGSNPHWAQVEGDQAPQGRGHAEGREEIPADPEAVRRGWHPDGDIVTAQGSNLVKMPAHNFVRRFERNRTPLAPNARAEFTSITVSGYAAVAVLELKSGRRPVYTDMMSLYKFDDGGKIVTKVFYTYPAPVPGR